MSLTTALPSSPRPRRPGAARGFILAALTALAVVPLHAEPVTFALDPARSSVTMGGTVSTLGQTAPLQEQAAGSLTARYSGTIPVELGEGTIRFLPGGGMVPAEDRAWQPMSGGAEGSAPASYGTKATLLIFNILPVNAVAASRGLVFDTGSPELPVTGGTFPTADLAVQFAAESGSLVDYRVTGQLSLEGSRVLAGILTNRVSSTGSLATVDGVETLTVPVDADFSFVIEGDLGLATFNLRFTGQLVATRASVPEPEVVFTPPSAAGGPLVLSYPDALYKLQRATTLTPPDWTDVADVTSPVSIPPEGPGAFFRVVPR